jgi:hypothetical protein
MREAVIQNKFLTFNYCNIINKIIVTQIDLPYMTITLILNKPVVINRKFFLIYKV